MHHPGSMTLIVALGLSAMAALHAGAAANSGNPIDRWAEAVGGRERVAAIRSIYREATIQVMGFEGSIKAWHTFDGKYRKEEQVATFSAVEIFDGTTGTIRQGAGPARPLQGAELALARSKTFANWNAVFFAFFPERRRGSVAIQGDHGIVLTPAGGIDWRITLDPQTLLPAAMIHQEGERTITVTFVSYETVDGVKFEKEIHRTAGDPRSAAVIRFTKTVLNPPVDPSIFSVRPAS